MFAAKRNPLLSGQFFPLVLLFAALSRTAPAVQAWVQRYSAEVNAEDQAYKIAADGSGNVIVAGASGSELLVIKYSGAGVALWTNRYIGPGGAAIAQAVAVDAAGNIYVTGTSRNSAGNDDYATIAYTGTGAGLWTNLYNGPGNNTDLPKGIALGGNGNVYVTGASIGSGTDYDYATLAYSASGTPLWTNRYNGPGNNSDQALAVAVDGSGRVYVTGSSPSSALDSDYATIAYSSTGTALWTNRYNGPGNNADQARALAVDASGNVYVTGLSSGTTGFSDYATIVYSSAGAGLWTNRWGDVQSDQAQAIAVDGSGNVYVTGNSTINSRADYVTVAYSSAGAGLWTNRYGGAANTNNFPVAVAVKGTTVYVTGSSTAAGSGYDYATIAYSTSGAALWINRYNGSGNKDDRAQGLAVDAAGNVFVTGYSPGLAGDNDFATVVYTSAGAALWTNRYNGLAKKNASAQAVAVDGSDNIYVTGTSTGNNSGLDYATVAYSGAGTPLWTNRYNGPGNNTDQPVAVAADGSGNVCVTGSSFTSSGFVYATIAYSNAGPPLWTNFYYGGIGDAYAEAIATDGNGKVYVTGYSFGTGANYDYATIAYTSAGAPLWTNRYNGPGNSDDSAAAVAVDANGRVYVAGGSTGSGSAYDYATIAYSSAGLPLWTNRYNGAGNSYDSASAVAVAGNSNVFVTGYSTSASGDLDYATVAYSSSGIALWTNRYNGPGSGDDWASAVAVGANGNVYVTGYSLGSGTSNDFATVAYSSAGVALWTNRYNGPGNGDDQAQAVAVDGSGNVYVAGYSVGAGSGYDFATIVYSSAGVAFWTNRYNGPANGNDKTQSRFCLAVTPGGAAIVSGASDGDFSSSAVNEFATVKYLDPPLMRPRFVAVTPLADKNIRLTLDAISNLTWRIDAATNINTPVNWAALTNIPNPSGTIQYTDLNATNFPRRFYRAVWVP